jgi:TM2 domain-containing membrane protein YozV
MESVNGGAGMKKNIVVAYLLWFFFGLLGLHRMYCGHVGSGITMLALTVIGGFTFIGMIGHVLLTIVAIWWLVDLFLTARLAS